MNKALAGQVKFAIFCQNIVDYLNRTLADLYGDSTLITRDNLTLLTDDELTLTVAGG